MKVAFNGTQHGGALSGNAAFQHQRFNDVYTCVHGFGCHQHIRYKNLVFGEALANNIDAAHQTVVQDVLGGKALVYCLLGLLRYFHEITGDHQIAKLLQNAHCSTFLSPVVLVDAHHSIFGLHGTIHEDGINFPGKLVGYGIAAHQNGYGTIKICLPDSFHHFLHIGHGGG
ncbi:hypothetical protein SDC9_180006 [bioreactor metagenome]|uniref:Uncharacterized protein n=1 Tax=bioreactor metagenome TaxID=1076179 RepID=A0A645H0G5_9ZZZZ